MGINVYLRSESGETLDSCLDPLGLVPKLLRHFDLSGTVCLRFVDPYGDTVFNYLQAPVLLGELAGIRPRLDDRTRALIDALIPMAERVESGSHLYLHFVGDWCGRPLTNVGTGR